MFRSMWGGSIMLETESFNHLYCLTALKDYSSFLNFQLNWDFVRNEDSSLQTENSVDNSSDNIIYFFLKVVFGYRSEVFCAKMVLEGQNFCGRKYVRRKAGLDGVQEEYSLPKFYFRNSWWSQNHTEGLRFILVF